MNIYKDEIMRYKSIFYYIYCNKKARVCTLAFFYYSPLGTFFTFLTTFFVFLCGFVSLELSLGAG